MAALARAKQRREAAVAAQTERMTAEKAAIAKAHEDAKEHGLVEKTAGESGAAGVLRNKWAKWLGSDHGGDVAARLAAEGGAPTVEETKLFSTWTRETRQIYSPVGRKGGGDTIITSGFTPHGRVFSYFFLILALTTLTRAALISPSAGGETVNMWRCAMQKVRNMREHTGGTHTHGAPWIWM